MNLSRSQYICAIQCPKMLRMSNHDTEECNPAVSDDDITDLAMGLFGEYKKGLHPINNEVEIIRDASFSYNGSSCSVDILRNPGNNKVEIYDVRSSTYVHDPYPDDIAYQNYILRNLGYEVAGAYLILIDKDYVRHGDPEPDKLFKIIDMTADANRRYDAVAKNIADIEKMMSDPDEPPTGIGLHCKKPYECRYFSYCTGDLPKPNVFDLGGALHDSARFRYHDNKIISYGDLLDQPCLDRKSRQQIEHELYDLPPHVNIPAIKSFLDELWYPLYFLDFESVTSGIPLFDGTRPYQQICFQYSLHYIEKEGGELKHKEFLAYPGRDPRRELCENLCRDIPEGACILIYNSSFEPPRIREMAKDLPDLKDDLERIISGMKDLMIPFRNRDYYCRDMHGSYSIKSVLPALYPDDPALDYHNLEGVHNGGEASTAFLRMRDMDPDELERTRDCLLRYCCLDTYAMVRILEKLREAVSTC